MTIPINGSTILSIVVIAVYIVMFAIGYSKGLLYELVNFVFTILSLFLAWFAAPVLSDHFPLIDIGRMEQVPSFLVDLFDLNKVMNNIAYFIIVFLVMKLLYVLLSLIFKSMNKVPVIGKLNQLLGGVFGIFNATLIVLALSMLLMLPLFKNGKEIIDASILKYIRSYSAEVLSFVTDKIAESSITETAKDMDIDSYRKQFSEWLKTRE